MCFIIWGWFLITLFKTMGLLKMLNGFYCLIIIIFLEDGKDWRTLDEKPSGLPLHVQHHPGHSLFEIFPCGGSYGTVRVQCRDLWSPHSDTLITLIHYTRGTLWISFMFAHFVCLLSVILNTNMISLILSYSQSLKKKIVLRESVNKSRTNIADHEIFLELNRKVVTAYNIRGDKWFFFPPHKKLFFIKFKEDWF